MGGSAWESSVGGEYWLMNVRWHSWLLSAVLTFAY